MNEIEERDPNDPSKRKVFTEYLESVLNMDINAVASHAQVRRPSSRSSKRRQACGSLRKNSNVQCMA